MPRGRLYTRSGELVHEFVMPPFKLTPEAVTFGERIFVLKLPFAQTPSNPAEPEYFEACGWSVDAAQISEAAG